jgi:hypothetical protein
MTNVEFFILLGTVLAGVIWQRVDTMNTNARIDHMGSELHGRIDSMSSVLHGKIDGVGNELNGKIDSMGNVLHGKIDGSANSTNARIDRISDDLKQFYRTLGEHEARLDNLEKK